MTNGFKSGFISLIGRPNVGKSTLMNQLIGKKIAITTDKPQTTRNRIQAIVTTETKQMVFIDTPGIHKPKTRLGEFMNQSATSTLREVDCICFLVEPDQKIGPGDQFIIDQLREVKTPVVLIINKIDQVEKESLLQIISNFQKKMPFAAIVPLSAKTGDNIQALQAELDLHMQEGPMFFPSDMVTDQPEKQLVAEIIREKALMALRDEIPHGLAVMIELFEERENQNLMDISTVIVCEKKSHKPIILGKKGQMIKKIGRLARHDIEALLGTRVNLQTHVKVKSNWRDSEFLMRNYGYDNKHIN